MSYPDAGIFDDIEDAIAYLDKVTGRIISTNKCFENWYREINPKKLISELESRIDWGIVTNRIVKYKTYRFESELQPSDKRRKIPVELSFYDRSDGVIYLHIRNISKVKEKELMLESFSKLIETNNPRFRRSVHINDIGRLET